MNIQEIKHSVTKALLALEPTEVRVHKESADVIKILVLSPAFGDMSLSKRISTCVKLIMDGADLHYLFSVEPVTAEEFKERLMPWPE